MTLDVLYNYNYKLTSLKSYINLPFVESYLESMLSLVPFSHAINVLLVDHLLYDISHIWNICVFCFYSL